MLLQIINFLVSLGITTLLFAMIYKVLPDVILQWHDVWIGAAVTAFLFTLGKLLLGLYLGKSDVTSGFGAAGSFMLILVWVYYSAQILLFGRSSLPSIAMNMAPTFDPPKPPSWYRTNRRPHRVSRHPCELRTRAGRDREGGRSSG